MSKKSEKTDDAKSMSEPNKTSSKAAKDNPFTRKNSGFNDIKAPKVEKIAP